MLKRFSKAPWPEALSLIFVFVMFGFMIVGTWLRFSPIPFWDMWDGTLGFIIAQRAGAVQEWWGQHNEHRIILSRILFVIDYNFFGGQSQFLIPLNIVIAAVSAATIFLFARRLQTEDYKKARVLKVSAFLFIGFLFSWTQQENFTWAFQSQFFLAQLLPLISLYLIARSSETQSQLYFALAFIFGVLAAGTMANGILIMPIIFIYLLVIWQSAIKAVIALLFAIMVPTLYFLDYVPIERHGSIGDALLTAPLDLLYYVFIYLGSPIYYLTGQLNGSRNIAALAGLALVCLCVVMAVRQLKQKQRSPYIVALLCFLLYIGATAFGTAGGRLSLGISGATSSRYVTPAIMAWAAFTLAMIASFQRPSRNVQGSLLGGTILCCGLALSYQFQALARHDDRLFNWEMAALALELGVRDEPAIGAVYPNADHALEISNHAKTQGLSVFGRYPYVGLSKVQGEILAVSDALACIGSLDDVKEVQGDERHWRVRGWMFDPASREPAKVITFTNEQGVIVGSGISGEPRPDVRDAIDENALTAGFGGYIDTLEAGTRIFAYGDHPLCRLELTVPN